MYGDNIRVNIMFSCTRRRSPFDPPSLASTHLFPLIFIQHENRMKKNLDFIKEPPKNNN